MIAEHTAIIDGLTIHYRTAGENAKPTLVFLHGWAARVDGFLGSGKVVSELSKYFYVIAPEHPGLCRSTPPKEVWGFDDFARSLKTLLKSLKIENPIIMGQSFGGGIATAYAKLYPHEVKVLILVDSVTTERPWNLYQKAKYVWCPLLSFIAKARWIPLFFKKIWISGSLGVPSKIINTHNVKDYAVMGEIPIGKGRSLDFDYKTLRIPLLLVWGNRDTWVTPLARAREIHEQVKDSKLIIVNGPHTVLYQRPQIVISEIANSL
jgi:pimeloyl-ACP methyl ester carboxylesterase